MRLTCNLYSNALRCSVLICRIRSRKQLVKYQNFGKLKITEEKRVRVNQEFSFTHFKQFGKYCGFCNWDLNIHLI